jgi:hypothetical protein
VEPAIAKAETLPLVVSCFENVQGEKEQRIGNASRWLAVSAAQR